VLVSAGNSRRFRRYFPQTTPAWPLLKTSHMGKVKILVVDDDPKLSRLVKLFLEQTRLYAVTEENRPAHALATARALQPEAILLDVDMPGKDGGQLRRELAADAQLSRVPVMFLTSLITTAEAGNFEVVRGGVPYLAKPVNPRALVPAVERLLASSAQLTGVPA
jgi:DNA-binding response OmpR family regulator